ncbi:MAG: NifU family protein [Chloroflexi bacterium]|jgi:Fe-S cluster biogenesis protein NfuA|nr:NifU family protein [Chloroflexota bacterium]
MSPENKEYTTEDRLRGLIDQLDAYIDHYHGGSVQFISLENNILTVRLGGACEGCSLKTATLKGWVEGTIKQFFPEITSVQLEA